MCKLFDCFVIESVESSGRAVAALTTAATIVINASNSNYSSGRRISTVAVANE